MHQLQRSTESIRKKGGGKVSADETAEPGQNKDGKRRGRKGKGSKKEGNNKDATES